jgi:hypothetical protein
MISVSLPSRNMIVSYLDEVYIYIYMYIYMYVCMYICMIGICIYIYSFSVKSNYYKYTDSDELINSKKIMHFMDSVVGIPYIETILNSNRELYEQIFLYQLEKMDFPISNIDVSTLEEFKAFMQRDMRSMMGIIMAKHQVYICLFIYIYKYMCTYTCIYIYVYKYLCI